MIPTIDGILSGLKSGEYTLEQCKAWLGTHLDLAFEDGYNRRHDEVMGALV